MDHPIRTTATRVGTGLVALAMLAWFLRPTPDWKLEPERLGIFFVALGMWLAAEFVPLITQAKKSRRHDVDLLGNLQALVTPKHLAFLRDQNFGTPISSEPLKAFYGLADEWRGVTFEFEDKEVQLAFAKLLGAARDLAGLVSSRTYCNGNYVSAETTLDLLTGASLQTHEHIRDMNDKAAKLLKQFESFYQMTRIRLKV